MAFEDLFVALRDNQFGQLRREKPLQSPDAPQFLDLFGDPRFETAVQFRYLIGALVQFADQPPILHRNHRLCGEVLQQRDLLVSEWPDFPTVNLKDTKQLVVFAEGHLKVGMGAAQLHQRSPVATRRRKRFCCNIHVLDQRFAI